MVPAWNMETAPENQITDGAQIDLDTIPSSETGSSSSLFLHWSAEGSSSTLPSGAQVTQQRYSRQLHMQSSSASIVTQTPFKRVSPTSPRTPIGFGSFVVTSKTSRPYWNDSGLRRFAESFSTLAFPHPNSMKRIVDSASGTTDPSICGWTPLSPSQRRSS